MALAHWAESPTVEKKPPGEGDGSAEEAKPDKKDAATAAGGDDYAPAGVEDDTDLKLLAAEERAKEGHVDDAASVTLRMLQTRLKLYARRNASSVIE